MMGDVTTYSYNSNVSSSSSSLSSSSSSSSSSTVFYLNESIVIRGNEEFFNINNTEWSRKNNNNSENFIYNHNNNDDVKLKENVDNYWALLAIVLVFATAAGNILVCLAIAWERRLQNVTNYFLMSLAITDLMVAVLVMPLGILTLVKGSFPLQSEHCLVWICLDVLFCTASIMHLCTISVDRYLSLRYPMRFGRNKTRKRVTLKIVFVWLLSIAMSLPLSLMYSKDHASVLVNGTCQIPDPVYKLVGSIICFYIPLCVMLLTYCLTIRLLAQQRQNLGGTNHQNSGWANGWMGQASALERRCTWKKLLKPNLSSTPNHAHSGTSTDTELSTLDTHELWLPDSSVPEPTPSTMIALHQFGAELLKLSRGLESVGTSTSSPVDNKLCGQKFHEKWGKINVDELIEEKKKPWLSPPTSRSSKYFLDYQKRRASTLTLSNIKSTSPTPMRHRFYSLPKNALYLLSIQSINVKEKDDCEKKFCKNEDDAYLELPPPCTCPYFGDKPLKTNTKLAEVKIISSNFRSSTCSQESDLLIVTSSSASETGTTTTNSNSNKYSINVNPLNMNLPPPPTPTRKLSYSKTASVVTWDSTRNRRRGSSFGGVKTSLLLTPTKVSMNNLPLRRSATLRNHSNVSGTESGILKTNKIPSSPCIFQRNTTIRSHHSRNSSVISRNSSRHGRIIRLEQKATKVLGVVFFTFVILWAPFFVLNLVPSVCSRCEDNIAHWVFDVVTWLGYASSMVNPIFYTIFNNVFRQAFKKVLLCRYGHSSSNKILTCRHKDTMANSKKSIYDKAMNNTRKNL